MTYLYKIYSLQAMCENGLPVLPFKILTRENYCDELKDFAKKNNLTRVMVRTDGKSKYSPSINNALVDKDLLKTVKDLFDQDFVVFTMHPANIYKNEYSLNIMKEDNKLIIEIVGHGFIATDMNRYGFLHESLGLDLSEPTSVHRDFLVDDKTYTSDREKKIELLDAKIIRHNNGYLLEAETYRPLPDKYIDYVINSYEKINKASKSLPDKNKNFVASMSFIDIGDNKNQPFFWDLYNLK